MEKAKPLKTTALVTHCSGCSCPWLFCIFPSSQEAEPGRGAITPQLELGSRPERHRFVPRKKHSWHDITQPSCQENIKYQDKHTWNGCILALLREVYLLLLISFSGGQETFRGLRNSLRNSGLARRDEIKWTQSLPYTSYLSAFLQWDNTYGIREVEVSKLAWTCAVYFS